MPGSASWRDRLVASDPELARLRQASRATLTALLSTAALHQLAQAVGQPTALALVGINTAIMGTVIVRDPTPRAQRITSALVPVAASATLIAGTLAAPLPWLRDGLFVAVAFVAALAGSLGPRGVALGVLGFLAYFFALFFHASLAQLPLMIAGIFVASAIAYLVRYGVLRERPAALIRQRHEALRRRLAIVLALLARALAEGPTPRRVRAIRRELGEVNESALAIEEQLDVLGDRDPASAALRERVFALELAVAELVATVRALIACPAVPTDARLAVARALSDARPAVRDASIDVAVPRLLPLASLHIGDRDGERTALAVRDALAELLRAAGPAFVPAEDGASRSSPAPPPTPRPALRTAVQATIAAALALAAGQLVSSSRGAWAVLAAFMVFTRANTRGAMLVRAWQRVLGTALGVLIGLCVAHAVQGHTRVELAVVFACVFVAHYTLQFAYAAAVGAFTTLIAVLYSLLGRFTPDLLVLRIEETVIGAGIGAAVAALVLPARTRERVRGAMATALRSLAAYLDAVVVARDPDHAGRMSAARALDRSLREIRGDVQRAGWAPALRPTRELARLYVAFAAVFFHARSLAGADWQAAPDAVSAVGVRLSANARALADGLVGLAAPQLVSTAPALAAIRESLPDPQAPRGPAATLTRLTRLDAALLELARVAVATALAPPLRRASSEATSIVGAAERAP